jgi:soluble cytochrome b562
MPTLSRTFARLLLGGALIVTLLFGALAPKAPARLQDPDQDKDKTEQETPLHQAMESMQSSMRTLRKQVDKPEESANALATVRAMQGFMSTAYVLNPPPQEGKNEKETALWNIAFRRRLLEVQGTLLDLEQAVVEGRTDDAKAGYSKLLELKKLGHDQFQIDDE